MIERTPDQIQAFILANTTQLPVPHCPQITLHLAHEAVDLWQVTQNELDVQGLPLPFWAFAWAGGQGLARYVLDHPGCVTEQSVLDLASGSGLVGIAAKLAGANQVLCADIDPFAGQAIALNAALNCTSVDVVIGDLIGQDVDANVVLVGDLFYERELAQPLWDWLQALHGRGKTVLIGDPGRAYLPKTGLTCVGDYQIDVTRALEDADIKRTRVWMLADEPGHFMAQST